MNTPPDPCPSWSRWSDRAADRRSWVNDLALRWGLIQRPAAIGLHSADQQWLMAGARRDGRAYLAPSELHVGDLAQLAELLPYLTQTHLVPVLDLKSALRRDSGRIWAKTES
jgi:hypothetical protein